MTRTLIIAALASLLLTSPALATPRPMHRPAATMKVKAHAPRTQLKRRAHRVRHRRVKARTRRTLRTHPGRSTLRGLARGLTSQRRVRPARTLRPRLHTGHTLRQLGSYLDQRGRQQRLQDLALMQNTAHR